MSGQPTSSRTSGIRFVDGGKFNPEFANVAMQSVAADINDITTDVSQLKEAASRLPVKDFGTIVEKPNANDIADGQPYSYSDSSGATYLGIRLNGKLYRFTLEEE